MTARGWTVLWVWTFGVTLLAMLVLTLLPGSPHLPTTGWDKANHVLAFSVLVWMGCRAFPDRTALVLIGLLAYGGLIEVLQSLTPDRVAEWNDLFADSGGLLIGLFATRFLEKIR